MKKKHSWGYTINHYSLPKKLLRIMKLSFFFTCMLAVNVMASAYSQQERFDLDIRNMTVRDVLKTIEQESQFRFFYNDEFTDLNKKVTFSISEKTIDDLLLMLLDNTEVSYKVMDNNFVVITPASMIQQGGVTGTITDAITGEALPGVNIQIQGTTQGTITDANGKYELNISGAESILIFSYVGYITETIQVGQKTIIDISLVPDVKSLEEVVVIGYGTQKKSDLTGSVSSVKTLELQKTPMTSIDQGLVGRASGVQVTQTSGMPGAVASIRVRGSSSLQGGNEPLYVIDGFPVYSGTGFGETGGKAQMSGLSTVNPADIESIEILKDASATAIYGARAANGVVLVTTKSGKKGHNQITFDVNFGIQKLVKKIDLLNAQEYAVLVNEAYTNDGLPAFYDAAELAQIATVGEGTDWQDEVFRKSKTQNYQLSFSGGDENTTYAISGNYYNQEGIVINSDFRRYSTRVNIDRKLNEKFKVGSHLSGSYITNNAAATDVGGEGGVVNGALKMNPILPVYVNEETGEYTQVNTPGTLVPNPVATAKEQKFNTSTSRLLGDVFGELEIIPGLKAKVSVGTDVMYLKANTYTPTTIYQSNGTSSATVGVNKSINWLNENTLTYNRTFNDIHSLNVLAGFTVQQNSIETVTASSGNFVNNVMEYNNLGAGSIYFQPGSSNMKWSLMSYLGRINYGLNNKYLVSVTARADGSSRFGANNKYGFFPSGSAAWRISEENFMQSFRNLVNNLKLRVSYGFTGNTEIGVYESLATLGSNSWTLGNQLVSGFYPNKIPNPDLKWEKTGQFDVGVDLGLYENRFRITADYYHKKTTDLLYSVAIPYVSGFETMLQNIGSLENKGFEFSFESDNLTRAFKWTTAFNISFNKNKVLALGGESYKEMPEGDGHLKTGSFRRLIVGEPVGVFYGYRFDGIFQNAEEVAEQTSSTSPLGIGLRRYKDLNGDNRVDANNDREILGDANPDFFGGLTNSFSFKDFELNVFFQYCYGNEIFNYNAIELETPTGGQNAYQDLQNRWKPGAPSNIYPKASTNRAVLVSDRFVEDGSYLKLKTISFSYNMPLKNNKKIDGLRIYVTGQNILTFTNYRGYDPEVSYRGASTLESGEDYGGYPQSRTFMMGIKLDL